MPDNSKRIPFTNMIYIGDGLSDVPCMKMMRAYGGQAIAVYQSTNRQGVEKLLGDGRVDFIFPADYRADTELDRTVRDILRMAVYQLLYMPSTGCWRPIPASSAASAKVSCRIRWGCSETFRKKPVHHAPVFLISGRISLYLLYRLW